MPDTPEAPTVNKEALNALTDLYYLYGDLVQHCLKSLESPEQLDKFYLRGGLRQMLETYYEHASIDPEAAGSGGESLTLDRMLPVKTISQASKAAWQQIKDARGDLKTYNDTQEAYGTPIPPEVKEVVRLGRKIIATREKRSRSGADVALVYLESAVVAYENHTLHIDSILIPLETNSFMDLVTDYMFNHASKGVQVNMSDIISWIELYPSGPGRPRSRAINDACRAVNEKVKQKLITEAEFFNTSVANKIIRNY